MFWDPRNIQGYLSDVMHSRVGSRPKVMSWVHDLAPDSGKYQPRAQTWIESQDYTPRSEDEEEGDEAAGGAPGTVDSFYGDMAAAAVAEEELVDDDGVDPSDAAEALKAMVQMMDEEQMREAAEMLDVKSQDLDSADLDSLDEEQLRSLLLHILDDTIDRLK